MLQNYHKSKVSPDATRYLTSSTKLYKLHYKRSASKPTLPFIAVTGFFFITAPTSSNDLYILTTICLWLHRLQNVWKKRKLRNVRKTLIHCRSYNAALWQKCDNSNPIKSSTSVHVLVNVMHMVKLEPNRCEGELATVWGLRLISKICMYNYSTITPWRMQ